MTEHDDTFGDPAGRSELEGLLAGAFDARARSAVPDDASRPAPRFAGAARTDPSRGDRRRRLLAPLSAAAAVLLAVGVGVVALRGGSDHRSPAAGRGTVASATTPVHIKLLNGDGQTYGVGMPVIAYFSHAFTDARALQRATTVTVNGTPSVADWYFERSAAGNGPIEGHLRPPAYWPAHARVHVTIAARALSAGRGLAFDNDLTLDFHTGSQEIATVDGRTHLLTLKTGSKPAGTFPVSIGSAKTPTASGIKVIMGKGESLSVTGPGYHIPDVKYTQRLTYDGEFLLAAPWNRTGISSRVNTSDGSTNLTTAGAKQLYRTLRVGDVLIYTHTGGRSMTLADGFGDWNVQWGEWQTGGLVPTH